MNSAANATRKVPEQPRIDCSKACIFMASRWNIGKEPIHFAACKVGGDS